MTSGEGNPEARNEREMPENPTPMSDPPDDGRLPSEADEAVIPQTDEPPPSPSNPAYVAADAIDRAASLAVVGISMTGFLWALSAMSAANGRGGIGPASLTAICTSVTALLLGWLTGVVLHGLAAVVRLLADAVETAGRTERQIVSELDRLNETLGAARAAGSGYAPPPASDQKAQRLAEIRQAIRTGAWNDAAELVRSFADTHPDDPDATRAADELASSREEAARDLLAKVEAAREVGDPERVIELRDTIKPLLDPDALRGLDRDLAKWFMTLIHRRLRAGTVRVDVAVLAGRVAESLDDTPEGASLRASLPTLRRAAGLCARCGRPYLGIENACPVCLTGATIPPPATAFQDAEGQNEESGD